MPCLVHAANFRIRDHRSHDPSSLGDIDVPSRERSERFDCPVSELTRRIASWSRDESERAVQRREFAQIVRSVTRADLLLGVFYFRKRKTILRRALAYFVDLVIVDVMFARNPVWRAGGKRESVVRSRTNRPRWKPRYRRDTRMRGTLEYVKPFAAVFLKV